MATRATEAATLNATLAQLKTDVDAYLAAGVGDHDEARAAVFNAIAGRLSPSLGNLQYQPVTGSGTADVPDAVRVDAVPRWRKPADVEREAATGSPTPDAQ